MALEALVTAGLWIGYFYVSGQEVPAKGASVWSSSYVWLAMALVATLAAPPILFFAVRNFVWLIRHGTEVQGQVRSISPLSKGGSRPVTYAYSVNGVEYTMRRDTPTMYADKYTVGSQVLVLVDPNKPKRATVLEVA
ncbi:DUF3592 domain-containing protein [Humisphaera borealis]|uniref:DUF3592 domain-containing protein n=1 Tax=Humisphaera borealis TaxID=2807512 RepID=A0A7M2X0B1_9BACT|nr:DUF3592 domain-containing protein [Humisphaera borealis]QOV91135.1 DUF3592 domain-containing protein [Humisphaera borealis]